MAEDKDLEILQKFLLEVRILFAQDIFSEEPSIYLEEDLRQLASDAWRRESETLDRGIREFDAALKDPQHYLRIGLDLVGLSGPSLTFKYAGFKKVLEKFKDVKTEIWKTVKPWVQRVFGWTNLILGSLTRVLTWLDPFKELKEGVENSLAPTEVS